MAIPVLDISSYFIVISSLINVLFNLVLVGFLSVNFSRKKTVGTFMLLLSYFFFALTSIFSIAYRIMYVTNGENVTMVIYFFASLGPLTLLPAFAYLYIFACRHILKDNEIIRINIFSIIMVFYGIVVALISFDNILSFSTIDLPTIFTAKQFSFSEPILITSNVFTITFGGYGLFIQIFQIVISIYITGRIGWRSLRLARKSDQPVRKRGLQTIGLGVILYLVGGMLSAFDSTFSPYPALMITVAAIRALVFASAYVAMYLGWIMPAWYRKLIRKKSWFEVQYQQMTKS